MSHPQASSPVISSTHQQDQAYYPAVAVLGPTGAGKTSLALHLAERFAGEIVSCDALQLYRGLDVGTAKPSLEERRGIPHHLIDILDPRQPASAGDYARRAGCILAQIAAAGHPPVIVGGTGFYFRALTEGLFSGPGRDENLRQRLATKSSLRLHRILQRLDPQAAGRIHPHDAKKLIRAIEVCLLARKPISQLQPSRRPLTGFRMLKLALDPPRPTLYRRLDQRCEQMFRQGLLAEVQSLLDAGIPPSAPAFQGIGYREALAVLEGRLDDQQALILAQRNTRRYAKRQWTWFRKEKDVIWIPGFGDDPEVRDRARALVGEWLAGSPS